MKHQFKSGSAIFLTILLALANYPTVKSDDEYSFHYDGMEKIAGSEAVFEYKLEVKPESDSVFKISGEIEQLVDIDENWKSEIIAYRSDTKDGEYTKFFALPKVSICTFMKTFYKKYIHEKVVQYSNLPHYDKCPLEKASYWIKDYPMDMNHFKHMTASGFYRIEAKLIANDEVKCGAIIFGCVKAK